MDCEVGSVVLSKAGRDKGSMLVVTEVLDAEYVLVADGRRRKIEHPKKKKVKHLKVTKKEKIDIQSNSQLRKLLGGGVNG